MEGYLGETDVTDDPKYRNFLPSRKDLAMHFIERYGQIEGEHHKSWVLDQVSRALLGTKPVLKLAKWGNGHTEMRVSLGSPSEEYREWVEEMLLCDEGNPQYSYDEGTPP